MFSLEVLDEISISECRSVSGMYFATLDEPFTSLRTRMAGILTDLI